jgi:hypothetical protein
MRIVRTFAITLAALLLGGLRCIGQSYYEYQFLFTGTAYQTNASGNLVGTPITDQTLLQSRAKQGNITNLSTVAIVYHIDGGAPMGDTVDIISTNGATLTTEFSFYYGSDAGLGRTAVTNAMQTQQRRLDYIYTFENSTYTFNNDDSIGLSMTTKSFTNTNAITNAVISGTMSWGVAPQGTNGPILCIGTFSLGQPLF